MNAPTLSPVELADVFGVSTGTLANWRAQGRGPAFQKPRKHRNAPVEYPRENAIRWGQTNGYVRRPYEQAPRRKPRSARQ